MEVSFPRKRRKITVEAKKAVDVSMQQDEEQSTDEKLAILSSIFETKSPATLLAALLDCDGEVERATEFLLNTNSSLSQQRKTSTHQGIQSSLNFAKSASQRNVAKQNLAESAPTTRSLTRKGKTVVLYEPSEIAKYTPCSIVHNFLPPDLANDLLQELLPETESFTSATFRLFDNVVKSPHTASFYVDNIAEAEAQKSAYLYNGSTLDDVREIMPVMRRVSKLVEEAVNAEIGNRVREHYPEGKKLKYQPPLGQWRPNAAFVNCYDGGSQSVGWHTDQLTYLGPHAVIGSLSLGVQREFRIRRIVPTPDTDRLSAAEAEKLKEEAADLQGQISLPLPHNSLLVMHAEMQESWKHSISPVSTSKSVVPHPIARNKRVNITYRWYRPEFEPKHTPRCRCKVKVRKKDENGNEVEVEERVPTVLKSVMRRKETLGKYVWMCQTQGRVDMDIVNENRGKGCGYFEWAEFDKDGVPLSSDGGQVDTGKNPHHTHRSD